MPSSGPDRSLPSPPPVPAVLRLVQRVMLGRWRATGEELYREVAALTGARVGAELLVSGCTDGVTAAWLATRTGAAVTGVDPDVGSIARAEARARAVAGVGVAPSYEVAPLDDLPHENAMFDATIGEPSLAAASNGSPMAASNTALSCGRSSSGATS